MATITINIADADLPRIVAGICGALGYQAILTPILGGPVPNPETPAQFARRMIVQDVKMWVKSYETQQAATAAATTAGASADRLGVT